MLGPFPVRWWRVGFSLLWLSVMGFAVAMALRTPSVHCRRAPGQPAGCTVRWPAPLARTERFPPGAIAGVEVFRRTGSKGRAGFTVTLLDTRGRETRLESYHDQITAEKEADRLRAFVTDGTQVELTREFAPRPGGYLVFGLGLLIGSFILFDGFSPGGGLRIAVDGARRTVCVRRTFLGVPVSRTVLPAAAEIVDVRIQYGSVPDWQRRRGQLPEPGARLVFVDQHGRELPATKGFLRGPSRMREALGVVRHALGLPSAPAAEQDEAPSLTSPVSTPRPPKAGVAPSAMTLPDVTPHAAKTTSWLRLFGAVALVGALVLGGMFWFANETQGWLELEVESRCEFDGATLLPGAQMSMALDPGSYGIRVFNPNVPGDWETQTFEIELHGTTHVRCRPTKLAR